MVRILGIKGLEERRQVLIRRSELHRQILRLDIETLGLSVDHIKARMRPFRSGWSIVAKALPILGTLLGRRSKGGFMSRMLGGITFASQILALLKGAKESSTATPAEPAGREA